MKLSSTKSIMYEEDSWEGMMRNILPSLGADFLKSIVLEQDVKCCTIKTFGCIQLYKMITYGWAECLIFENLKVAGA